MSYEFNKDFNIFFVIYHAKKISNISKDLCSLRKLINEFQLILIVVDDYTYTFNKKQKLRFIVYYQRYPTPCTHN
jgi:hypothetical protein